MRFLTEEYRGKLDAHASRLIDRAVDGAEIIRLVNNRLLAYAGTAKGDRVPAPTDCAKLLQRVLKGLDDLMSATTGKVTWDADLPTVDADADQLEQVFRHLIGNALNHVGEEQPEVHISADLEGNDWVFSVRDNGVGIAPEHTEEIFYLFSPYHNRQASLGSGISLAVCKKIVEQHGGRIWVDSSVGDGTTFRFSIPQR